MNHAAGPQGREGWKQILATIVNDLGEEITVDHHHLIAEGEFVVDHMTMYGHHQASTMPLLAGTAATAAPVAWTYIHIWRVVDGVVVEHCAGTMSASSDRSAHGRPVARHSCRYWRPAPERPGTEPNRTAGPTPAIWDTDGTCSRVRCE